MGSLSHFHEPVFYSVNMFDLIASDYLVREGGRWQV